MSIYTSGEDLYTDHGNKPHKISNQGKLLMQ